MNARWMAAAALALVGCDDTLFGADAVVEGEGYDAVVEVFEANCNACHAGSAPLGDLALDVDLCDLVGVDAAGAYEDDDGNPLKLIVAGDSASSLIWHKVEDSGLYGGVMPTDRRMDQANIDIIANWIDNDAAGECAR